MSFYKSSTTRKGMASINFFGAFRDAVTAVLLLVGFVVQAHAVCYVNGAATGKNDGSSWADAYTNPQFALLNTGCSEIWVAKGVYKPTLGTDRTVSFAIPPGITVYGGFAGGETSRDQRAPMINVTVLSGDVDDDDANSSGSGIDVTSSDVHGNNSYHVVMMGQEPDTGSSPVTVLDGFTITGGNANGAGSASFGGGLYCAGRGDGRGSRILCRATIRNVTFSGNAAAALGGGLYNDGVSGGLSSPQLIDVVFSGNRSDQKGGAIFNNGSDGGTSSPTLTNVFVSGNTAPTGGAMYDFGEGTGASGVAGTSNPILSGVVFAANTAGIGGAVYNDASNGGMANPTFAIVTFNDNTASDPSTAYGGGIYSVSDGDGSDASPTLINSTMSGNKADDGAAFYNDSKNSGKSRPQLTNVTIAANTAEKDGGALYNTATSSGDSSPNLINVILWADQAFASRTHQEIANVNGHIGLAYSVIQGDCPSDPFISCVNVLSTDPELGTLQENGGFTRTMLLGSTSSAIDTGFDAVCPAIDQRGTTRPQGAHCDIGAIESLPLPPPIAQPESITIPENTTGHILLAASDLNPGGPFTFHTVTSVAHGLLVVAGASVSYIPTTNYVGSDSFTYTATDTNGTSAPATVSIQVTGVPPVADPKSLSVPHNTSKDVTLTASDSNAGTFTYKFAIVLPTSHGTVTLAGNVASYTPITDYTGPDSFTYTATDVNGTSAPALVTIQVAPAPPVAQPRSIVVPYNTSKSVTFGATDSNLGGPFAYMFTVASSPTHGTLGLVEGDTILYTPTHNYSGPDAFTYTVKDANGVSVPATVTITVLPPGGGPTGSTTAIPTSSTWSLLTLAGLLGLTCVWRKRNT